jgi:hypothetical protein
VYASVRRAVSCGTIISDMAYALRDLFYRVMILVV